jgi:hypothetical protein
MNDADEQRSLEQARAFLAELGDDERSAPPEFRFLVAQFQAPLADSILRFKDRRIAARELDAHVFQIRLTYSRELQKLLGGGPPPTARFVRSA